MLDDWAFWWEFIKAVVMLFGPPIVAVVLFIWGIGWIYQRVRPQFDVRQGESFTNASDESIAEQIEEMRSELDQYRSPREKDPGRQLPRNPDGSGGGWGSHHGRLDGEGSDPG